MTQQITVGIDVAKASLEVACSDSETTASFDNTPQGIKKLVKAIKRSQPKLIVLEPTGGYERDIVTALLDAGLPIARADARRVHYFIRSQGQNAKTDRIDAHMLARFAQCNELRRLTKQDPQHLELKQLVLRRSQLVGDQNRERLRLEKAPEPIKQSIQKHIDFIGEQLRELEADMKNLFASSKDLKGKADILQSVKGIGFLTAAVLIAQMPELGDLKRSQITALAGLAPWAKDSGANKGKRSIRGGRTMVRSALYMATRVAVRWNQTIAALYRRLRNNGHSDKSAIVACMRKLLHITNALLRDGVHWNDAVAAANMAS